MENPGPPKFREVGIYFWNWLYLFWEWVTDNMGTDYFHEADAGRRTGVTTVRKYGRAPAGIQSTLTDVWDRSDATPTQQIWLAPTAARIHSIVGAAADTDGGAGCNTIQIYGLTSWSTKETSEIVTMAGAGGVNTANSYVIIHRMKCLTWGASGPNSGVITATAATDATVTAQINSGEGQTQMAIYGIPSTQKCYMEFWYANINKSSGANSDINFILLANPSPDVNTTAFLRKQTRGLQATGTTSDTWYKPLVIDGPCIIKAAGVGSANDIEADAGFYLLLEDN